MSEPGDLEFAFDIRKNGDVVIRREGRTVMTLRGHSADRFLRRIERGDPQQEMARVTGNYKRGNER